MRGVGHRYSEGLGDMGEKGARASLETPYCFWGPYLVTK